MSDLYFRPGTWDSGIWQAVAGANEYGLPERFPQGATVIDIGAHIGAFTYACLDRNAALVVAVEPEIESARSWHHNLHRACKATDRSLLITAACWRSDRVGPQHVDTFEMGPNTGAVHVFGRGGQPTRAIALDTLIDFTLALSPGRITLLKLDCEGSEWPILYTSQKLDLVQEIIGEYHVGERPGWEGPTTVEELLVHLGNEGFSCDHIDRNGSLGLFHAWRDAKLCEIPRAVPA